MHERRWRCGLMAAAIVALLLVSVARAVPSRRGSSIASWDRLVALCLQQLCQDYIDECEIYCDTRRPTVPSPHVALLDCPIMLSMKHRVQTRVWRCRECLAYDGLRCIDCFGL